MNGSLVIIKKVGQYMSFNLSVSEESAIMGHLIAEAYKVKKPINVNGIFFISSYEFARLTGVTRSYVNLLAYRGNSIRKLQTVRRDDRGSVDVYIAELVLFPWPNKGKEKIISYLWPIGKVGNRPITVTELKNYIKAVTV
jgi:hypothetical protein